MKRHLLWMLICLALPAALAAQQAHPSVGNSDRMFFPSDMFWGYGQFDLAPPHNEIDPNLCRSDAGKFGGVNAPCNAFARYMISGYTELWPFGRGQFRRFFLFGDSRFLFGKNLPQTLYTWSFSIRGIHSIECMFVSVYSQSADSLTPLPVSDTAIGCDQPMWRKPCTMLVIDRR